MEKEIIERIIAAGNSAPSGSNSQPWKFIVRDNTVRVIALPEMDHRILNFRKRGTYVAHGALLENMGIAARHFGYSAAIDAFPEGNDRSDVVLTKNKDVNNGEDLYDSINARHTNRRPYISSPLTENEKEILLAEAQRFPSCELAVKEGPATHMIAKDLAMDIMITLKHPLLHRLLFEEILWEEEHQNDRKGLYVRTMEVAPPKSSVFKLMSDWKKAQFLGKLGISKKIYTENVKTIGATALLGAIAIQDDDRSFIEAGRMIENIWLRATSLGLGLQVVTGIFFLWQYANLGTDDIFSPGERSVVDGAYERIRSAFGAKKGVLALAFRVGKAQAPSAVSIKRPPRIQWE